MDALFAQPTQPASAPRVRAFAELALNEIRSGVDGDASLLADKQAFSEFMDRVSESVLLGRREPPSAASVLSDTQDSSQQGEDESADLLRVPSPKNDVSTASPAPSLQPFDVNISSNTGSSAAVTAADLEALSSKLAFSPRRHHRQRKNDGASGRAAQTQQSSQGSGDRPPRVRFADCNEDDDLEFRKHGAEDFVHDEEGPGRGHDEDLGNEAPLTSGTLAGPSLLEELRRWRSEASAEIITDRKRPPVSPPQEATTSGRPPPPPPPSSCASLPPQLHGVPPPSLTAVHRGNYEAASTMGGTLKSSERASRASAPAEPRGLRATTGGGVDGGDERNGVTRGWAGGQTTGEIKDSIEDLSPKGATPRAAQGSSGRRPLTMQASADRQHTGRGVGGGPEETCSDARRWRDIDSHGRGKGRPKEGREEVGKAVRSVEEGEQDKDGATELSLDLSDCSDEKLGVLLQRGRRLGSSLSG